MKVVSPLPLIKDSIQIFRSDRNDEISQAGIIIKDVNSQLQADKTIAIEVNIKLLSLCKQLHFRATSEDSSTVIFGTSVGFNTTTSGSTQSRKRPRIEEEESEVEEIVTKPISRKVAPPMMVDSALEVGGYVRAKEFYLSSDIRLKTKVEDLVGCLEAITSLQGKSYVWKEDDEDEYNESRRVFGMIAQEVQVNFPELVIEDENGYLAVNYVEFIPFLIEAIKEHVYNFNVYQESINLEIEGVKRQLNELSEMNSQDAHENYPTVIENLKKITKSKQKKVNGVAHLKPTGAYIGVCLIMMMIVSFIGIVVGIILLAIPEGEVGSSNNTFSTFFYLEPENLGESDCLGNQYSDMFEGYILQNGEIEGCLKMLSPIGEQPIIATLPYSISGIYDIDISALLTTGAKKKNTNIVIAGTDFGSSMVNKEVIEELKFSIVGDGSVITMQITNMDICSMALSSKEEPFCPVSDSGNMMPNAQDICGILLACVSILILSVTVAIYIKKYR
eukprot:TRINITY_DN667_c0_g1_i4.p1 TRINITY_DN667_c0_g1~~TRINITY_DN667_c0_g1_i4.p1  ORF type:complete len:503 (+),score=119.85 TRINITY_DN667_c0_g1_i4:424-1932(+)